MPEPAKELYSSYSELALTTLTAQEYELKLELAPDQVATTWLVTQIPFGHPIAEGSYLILKDISSTVLAREQISELGSRYNRLIDLSHDSIVIYVNAQIVFINDPACVLIGGSREQLFGLSIRQFVHPDYWELILQRIQYMVTEGKQTKVTEIKIINLLQETIDVEVTGVVIQYHGQPAILTVIRDIRERKKYEQDIFHQAYHDSLTGLPNRRWFEKYVFQLLEEATEMGKTAAMLFLDFDMFKHINDSFGHQFGDLLLQEIAKRLVEEADAHHQVIRMGGDEFTLVALDANTPAEIIAWSERILSLFRSPFHLMDIPFHATCSIGIALFPQHGVTSFKLLKSADIALYEAKRNRNCAVMFNPSMGNDALLQITMINDLHMALANNWFELYYQPQINFLTGEIQGTEALVRLNHPQRGLVPPVQFIPIAESSGIIIRMGKWILNEACRQTVTWQKHGFPALPVSVNISIRQFQQDDFVETVLQAVEDSGIAPHLLDLEITESCASDTPRLEQVLQTLKPLGITVSIDDFGTGYSSLSYLSKLRIDKLKIDRSFIVQMMDSERDANLVQTIITMAHNLKMKVVAEGLETDDQAEMLKDWHCDTAQGFFYSRPLTVNQLESYFRNTATT